MTKLNEALISKLCEYVRAGSYPETAAKATGIGLTALARWQRTGNEVINREAEAIEKGFDPPPRTSTEHLSVEFMMQMEIARAEAETSAVAAIVKAGTIGVRVPTAFDPDGKPTDWQMIAPEWRAIAWYLERAFPARWGRRQALEISGVDGGPLQVQSISPIAALHEALSEIEGRMGGEDAVPDSSPIIDIPFALQAGDESERVTDDDDD